MVKSKIRGVLFILFISGWNITFAQYLLPKKIKGLTQTQLLLEETDDAKLVLENLSDYQHIEKVLINGEVDIAIACKALSLIDAVEDLELRKFDGILSDEDIQNIEWVPNLFIYIPVDREEAFLLNPAWQYIRNAVIEFQEIPVDFEFFQGWKSIKYLCLLGDFNATQAQNAAVAIRNYIPKIEQIGFSLLDIKDMPMALSELPYLKSVEIYNSIDMAQGYDWDNLGEITRPLFKGFDTIYLDPNQRTAFVTKPLFVPLHYFAFEPEITTSQEKFIENRFPTKSYTNDYLWYEDEAKKNSDFLQFRGVNLSVYQPIKSFQNAVLSEYSSNDAIFQGKGDSNYIFLLPNKGALIIPANSLEITSGFPYSGSYTAHVATANKLEDLFAEGASMQFDSIGKTFSINPEFWVNIIIYATDSKEPLTIKSGNFLQFSYLTEKKNIGSFYSWNSNSSKWENYYDYDYQFDDDKIRAIDFYQIAHGKRQHIKQIANESYSLDDRFELAGFHYLLNPGEKNVKIKKENGFWINRNTAKGDKTIQWVRGRPMFKLRLLQRQKTAPKFQDFMIMSMDRGLMPEWKELEDVVLSFETNLNKKEITKMLSKKRWLDFRLVESSGFYALELKTQNGFYEIQLSHPLERYKVLSDKGEKMNRKLRSAINKYFDERNMKDLAMLMFEKQKSSQIERSQYATIFDRMHSNKDVVKSFKIRSLGEFAVGVVTPCDLELNTEIILSDYGKVPLNPNRVWIYFKNGSSVGLDVTTRIPFNYKVRDIAAILAETKNSNSSQITKNGKHTNILYYYLSGKDLLTQGIAPNKIMYLPLKPLPQHIKNHNELSDFMNWSSDKKKKLRKSKKK